MQFKVHKLEINAILGAQTILIWTYDWHAWMKISSSRNMFKLIGMEINAILGAQTVLIWTYDLHVIWWLWWLRHSVPVFQQTNELLIQLHTRIWTATYDI